jgi:hypothetical protein
MGILPANILHGAQEQPVDVDKEQPLVVRVTDVNRHSHTDNIVRESRYNVCTALLTPNLLCQIRQKGGIGSTAYDEKQLDIRKAFFGGKTEPLPDSDIKAHGTDEENIIK